MRVSQKRPSGAKALTLFATFMARLKPCPCYKPPGSALQQARGPCPCYEVPVRSVLQRTAEPCPLVSKLRFNEFCSELWEPRPLLRSSGSRRSSQQLWKPCHYFKARARSSQQLYEPCPCLRSSR